jgi:hypothetical protein
MLKELNRLWERAKREAAAWRRGHRKLPHNRVRRERRRDAAGRVVGYGPPQLLPVPPLTTPFCRVVDLPSGRTDVTLVDRGVAAAYRLARRPCPTAGDVKPLPVSEADVRRLFEESCQ